MVFNVNNCFQKHMLEKEKNNKLEFFKCQVLTAEGCGVSTSTFSRICKEPKTLKDQSPAIFVSLIRRINILKITTHTIFRMLYT
jgi:hypothetical protein